MAAIRSLYLREINDGTVKVDKRVFYDRTNPLEFLTETQVHRRYRFRPAAILYIVDTVEDAVRLPTNRSFALPPLLQVLITLRVLATGSFFSVVADTEPKVGAATVHRVFWRVVQALITHVKEFVNMPKGARLARIKQEFYAIAGFPNVIGCIDGTQIPIQAPKDNENDFINRKGFHSINCQMVCDSGNKFVNVVARWPGSAHDSRIFRESALAQQMLQGEYDGTLLGDSGYPCRRYLLVPYANPIGRHQEKFNAALTCTRVRVEQTFGILKRKFACLKMLRLSPSKACSVVTATVILHNIAVDYRDIDDGGDLFTEERDFQVPHFNGDDLQEGKRFRDWVALQHFNN